MASDELPEREVLFGVSRRFDSSAINAALDSRLFASEAQLASEIGISEPTLRRVRRGQTVHSGIALQVILWISSHPPTADAEKLLAGVT
jgi:hypothetical protein